MIYIRNCSSRIIHLADSMLLPDDKIEDKDPRTGKPYSDNPVIKMFIDKDMLELVDVRPVEKESVSGKKEIKVEYEEVEEAPAPEEKPMIKVEEEEQPAPAEVAEKTTSTRGRKKKES